MQVYGETETNTYYYLKDHLGSVIGITDESGNLVESYTYDAWGNITVYDASGTEISESVIGNRYTFQGREISWASGLYYFRARWYDASIGRFLSKDPIGISGGLNQYVFCGNDPVNYIDPLGLIGFWGSPGGRALGRELRPIQNKVNSLDAAMPKRSISQDLAQLSRWARDAGYAHYQHHNDVAYAVGDSLRQADGLGKAMAIGETALVGGGMISSGILTTKAGVVITVGSSGAASPLGIPVIGLGIEQMWYGTDLIRGVGYSFMDSPPANDECK